jgi:hypothetical protein
MNRITLIVAAIVTFGIAIANIILGQNLILPLSVMIERAGGMPWYITWAMVWLSVLCALALGGFLIAATVRRNSHR